MKELLERTFLIATIAAVSATLLSLVPNGIHPEGADAWFGVRLGGYVLPYLLLVAGTMVVPVAVGSLVVPPLSRLFTTALAGYVLYAALIANRSELFWVVPEGPLSYRALATAAFHLSLAALAVMAILPLASRRLPRLLTVLTLLAVAGALFPRPGGGAVPAVRVDAAAPPLLLIGIDGADWDLIEPLIDRGELPHLQSLRERAAWGPLKTVVPTRSPLIWNTIVTGRGPKEHGIDRYKTVRFPDLFRDFSALWKPKAYGLEHLYGWLRRGGTIFHTTVTSSDRRVPAYWNIVSMGGGRVAVINWWASWPAEPVNGFLVSERIHFARLVARGMPAASRELTFPPDLYGEIEPLLVQPEDVTYEDARRFMDVTPAEFEKMKTVSYRHHVLKSEFRYMVSMFETDRRVALLLLKKTRDAPTDLLFYFRLPDLASHAALGFSELVEDHLGARPEEVARYGRVVSEAYRSVDRLLGELASGWEGNIVIVSDHGFELEHRNGRPWRYDHSRAPAGIFLAAGPAFRPGRVEGTDIYDILPTLLFLKGLPIPEDARGEIVSRAFEETFAATEPRRIASYGTVAGARAAISASTADETMIDRLRALGYVQ